MSATVNAKIEQAENVTSKATVRMHRLLVDRSVPNGGMDRGPSGGEYLLVGLGGCFTSHLLAANDARGAPLAEVRVVAEGRMSGTPERFTAFVLAVTAQCSDDKQAIRLVTIAARGCQVVNTLRQAAAVVISFNDTPVPFDESPLVP